MGMGSRKRRARKGSFRATPPRKLYRTGDLCRFTGLTRQSIHRDVTLGLISEDERTESGHRLFGEEVFERLRRIEELKETKTLEEIAKIFRTRRHPQ